MHGLGMPNPIHHLVPMVVTGDLDAIRRHYTGLPGAQIDIDMPNYVQVRFGTRPDAALDATDGAATDQRPTLAFMNATTTGAFDQPQQAFGGTGLVVSVPVDDADAHHRALRDADVALATAVSDKPWGWRSFLARDPAGVTLDFFHVKADASVDAAS